MYDMDKLLQDQLQALENGKSFGRVLHGLPEEAKELAPLISLVSAVHTMEHPRPSPQVAQPQRFFKNGRGTNHASQTHTRSQLPWHRLVWVSGLAGVMLVLLLGFVSMVGLGFWLTGPGSARAATLMDVSGQVEVASQNSPGSWQIASNGERVFAGSRIRTGSASSATLLFYDGSRSNLSANTDVTLNTLGGGWQKNIQVGMIQRSGVTNHSVVPLRGEKSTFIVHTPLGLASVRGTIFNVAVDNNGQARFVVSKGKVLVSNQNSQIYLIAGQVASISPDQGLSAAAYQFTLQGQINSIAPDEWIVASVPFSVTQQTVISGSLQVGDYAVVEGHLLDGGNRIADSIVPATETITTTSFTGSVDSTGVESWVVGGVTVKVNNDTQIDNDIQVGDPVRVTFVVQEDGSWLALKIESLVEEPAETPTPTPTETEIGATETLTLTETVTPTMTATPTATLTPTGTVTATVTSEPSSTPVPTFTPTPSATITATVTVSPTAVTNCTGANPQPKGLSLAQQYGVPYDEIMGWFCQGFGFGEIDLAYGLSRETGVPVPDIFEMRRSGLGWGLIKQRLHDTIAPTPTPNPGGPAPSAIPQPTSLPTITPGASSCPGPGRQPLADNIAQRYGVSYNAVVSWYCQGFSYSDIDHAYQLSQQYNVAVADIFDMRSAGLNWGQINQKLKGGNPGNHNPPHKKRP